MVYMYILYFIYLHVSQYDFLNASILNVKNEKNFQLFFKCIKVTVTVLVTALLL